MVRWSSSTLHCFAAALVGLLLVLKGTALGFFWQVPAPESLPSSLPAGRLFVVAPPKVIRAGRWMVGR